MLYGKVESISEQIVFESPSPEGIEDAFREAADRYLAFCKAIGRRPAKPYKGMFNVRVSPVVHQKLAMIALEHEDTLNNTVAKALNEYVDRYEKD